MTRLDKFKKVCRKYLYIRDDTFIDVFFGVIFANRLDSPPVWLYLIGPPSIGKSVLAQAVSKSNEIYALSRLTPAALVSGFKVKGKSQSLLPKLNGKVLILKDFTEMLNMRYEKLLEVLGQLRGAHDGEAAMACGVGTIGYDSKFGLIACVTRAIDKHIQLVADLGERFISYRLPDISKVEEAKRCMKAMNTESLIEKKETLSGAALFVLEGKPKPATISEYDKLRILKICQIVALGRCSISRDNYTKEMEIPSPESAVRLSEQLSSLAIGIAMTREKKKVTKEELGLVRRVAVHSIPEKRLLVINSLLTYWPDYVIIQKIIDKIPYKFSEVYVRRWLDEMELLGLIDRKEVVGSKGRAQYRWQLRDGSVLKEVLFGK